MYNSDMYLQIAALTDDSVTQMWHWCQCTVMKICAYQSFEKKHDVSILRGGEDWRTQHELQRAFTISWENLLILLRFLSWLMFQLCKLYAAEIGYMTENGFWRRQSWHMLWNFLNVCHKRAMKTIAASISSGIQTRYISNTSVVNCHNVPNTLVLMHYWVTCVLVKFSKSYPPI